MPIQLTITLLTHNRCNGYLQEALDSILRQTYRDFDLMVLDNGSIDDTPQVVLGYKDRRITYIRHPVGKPAEYNGASALWFARGKRLLIAHDDDILEPTMVEQQMSFMDAHPDMSAVAVNASLMDETGRIVQPLMEAESSDIIFGVGEYFGYFLQNSLLWPTSALMIDRTKIHTRSKSYNAFHISDFEAPQRYYASDTQFFCRLNASSPIGYIAKPLIRWRMHTNQHSRNVDLSDPMIGLLARMKMDALRNPVFAKYLPMVEAALIRHGTQPILMSCEEPKGMQELKRRVQRQRAKWEHRVQRSKRVLDEILPFELLLSLLGLRSSLPKRTSTVRLRPTNTRSTLAFRAWFERNMSGGNLFDQQGAQRKVAILGSVFVAHLLVLEARRAGVEVVCCLDSNSGRQGRKVFGVPIYGHDWLRENAHEVDTILLSSERNNEEWIADSLTRVMGPKHPQVASWKDLSLPRRKPALKSSSMKDSTMRRRARRS